MGPLNEAGIRAPPSGFEGGRVQKAVVQGDEALAHAVGDFIEVACAKLVRYQAVGATILASRRQGGRCNVGRLANNGRAVHGGLTLRPG